MTTFTLTGNCFEAFVLAVGKQLEPGYVRGCIDDFVRKKANEQREIIGVYAVCLKRKIGDQTQKKQVRLTLSGELGSEFSKVAIRLKGWELSSLAKIAVMHDAYSKYPDLF